MTQTTWFAERGGKGKVPALARGVLETGRIILGSLIVVAAVLAAVPASAEEKSLYERLGGYNAIAATVDDLVDRLYVNGTLNANPAVKAVHDLGQKPGFKYIVTAWVVEKTGGAQMYPGRPMDKAHAHLGLTDREFDIVMNECRTTFYKFNVPAKELEEVMTILESFRPQVVTVAAKSDK